MTTLDIIEDTTTSPTDGDGADPRSHYIRKAAWEAAFLDGIPATALCGKTWLPTKDTKDLPICQGCKDIYDDNDRMARIND